MCFVLIELALAVRNRLKMCAANRKRCRHLYGHYKLSLHETRWRNSNSVGFRRRGRWRRPRLFTRHTVRQQIFDYMLHAPSSVHRAQTHAHTSSFLFNASHRSSFVYIFFSIRFLLRHKPTHTHLHTQEFTPILFQTVTPFAS